LRRLLFQNTPSEISGYRPVARGKILTTTEHFSEFNSYNACNDVIDGEKSNLQACSFKKCSVIALGLLSEAY